MSSAKFVSLNFEEYWMKFENICPDNQTEHEHHEQIKVL